MTLRHQMIKKEIMYLFFQIQNNNFALFQLDAS